MAVRLAADSEYEVRLAAIAHRSVAPYRLRRYAQHRSAPTRRAVAAHRATPTSTLHGFAHEGPDLVEVHLAVANNPHSSQSLLRTIATGTHRVHRPEHSNFRRGGNEPVMPSRCARRPVPGQPRRRASRGGHQPPLLTRLPPSPRRRIRQPRHRRRGDVQPVMPAWAAAMDIRAPRRCRRFRTWCCRTLRVPRIWSQRPRRALSQRTGPRRPPTWPVTQRRCNT